MFVKVFAVQCLWEKHAGSAITYSSCGQPSPKAYSYMFLLAHLNARERFMGNSCISFVMWISCFRLGGFSFGHTSLRAKNLSEVQTEIQGWHILVAGVFLTLLDVLCHAALCFWPRYESNRCRTQRHHSELHRSSDSGPVRGEHHSVRFCSCRARIHGVAAKREGINWHHQLTSSIDNRILRQCLHLSCLAVSRLSIFQMCHPYR